MPAVLTVDQSLVDNYLARVDRFFENVERFEQQLKEMTNAVKERFTPDNTRTVEPMYEKSAVTQPSQAVITADDIDIDALLKGVDLGDGISI